MNLLEVISENAVTVNVKTQNREEVFEYVCDLLLKDGSITSKKEFKQDSCIRELQGKTRIGDRITTPHGKPLAVKCNCISVLKPEWPIQQETLNGQPARVFTIFAINQRDKDNHFLRLMASVVRELAQGETRGKLMGSSTKGDILETFYQEVTTPLRTRGRQRMNIVGVTAYTTGTAHTYIAKEKLEQAARKLGYICRIETQGSIGVEEQLIPGEVEAVSVVVLAVDVGISGENRSKGKPVICMSMEKAMKNTGALLQSTEEAPIEKKDGGD